MIFIGNQEPHFVPEKTYLTTSIPFLTMAVDMPLPPPTSALPQLPVSRLRGPVTNSETPSSSSATPPTSKLALRTPSKVQKPPGALPASHATSSPSIPTLRSTSAHHTQSSSEAGNKEVRRSVSIANFPQPPKVQRRTGLESKYSSAAYYSPQTTSRSMDRQDLRSPRGTESGDSQSGSLRLKRLKTKTSSSSLSQMYNVGPTPTLLDGSGNGKAIPSGQAGTRASNDLASVRSPVVSRSSSAQGSESTSATTFEDGDERKAKEGGIDHVATKGDKRNSEKEAKGNVIVSVRVRPDAGGDKASGKDWLVDGRQSLVAYRGREGGDYYYGKPGRSSMHHLIGDSLQCFCRTPIYIHIYFRRSLTHNYRQCLRAI